MNKRVRFLTTTLVVLCASARASFAGSEALSTAPLSVDAAISEALKDSPQIQSGEAAVSESSWRKFQAVGSGFLPKISAGFNHFFTEQYEDTSINFGGTFLNFPGRFSH